MSNRYEREIEEILRNTHVDDDRPSVKDRIRALNRRPARRTRLGISFGAEFWFIVGLVLAFAAATARWIVQTPNDLMNLIIGAVATAGFVVIAGTIINGWITAGRRPLSNWRGQSTEGGRGPGPRPFVKVRKWWNLLQLRRRYHRGQ